MYKRQIDAVAPRQRALQAVEQAGQGVGYLDDGTMVVVEDGLKHRGKAVRVQVVNNVQTSVGRMIFAKLDREEAVV